MNVFVIFSCEASPIWVSENSLCVPCGLRTVLNSLHHTAAVYHNNDTLADMFYCQGLCMGFSFYDQHVGQHVWSPLKKKPKKNKNKNTRDSLHTDTQTAQGKRPERRSWMIVSAPVCMCVFLTMPTVIKARTKCWLIPQDRFFVHISEAVMFSMKSHVVIMMDIVFYKAYCKAHFTVLLSKS